MKTPEDDEFKRIEAESGWRKRQLQRAIEDDDIQDYKKHWKGLTDTDIEKFANHLLYRATVDMVLAIEKLLKDRNT
jgi:hypothetical protein